MRRRERGEPLAHITGVAEFCALPLAIGPGVFVPRPRAEILLQVDLGNPGRILDLGCGCGALAAAIRQRLPDAELVASDLEPRALHFAAINGRRYNFEVRRSNWLEHLDGRFDLIVAYLPHVPESERQRLDADYLRAEGELSVLGGKDGLDSFRRILPGLARHGRLLTLLEKSQVAPAARLAEAAQAELRDLGGEAVDRVVEIRAAYLPALRDSK